MLTRRGGTRPPLTRLPPGSGVALLPPSLAGVFTADTAAGRAACCCRSTCSSACGTARRPRSQCTKIWCEYPIGSCPSCHIGKAHLRAESIRTWPSVASSPESFVNTNSRLELVEQQRASQEHTRRSASSACIMAPAASLADSALRSASASAAASAACRSALQGATELTHQHLLCVTVPM